MAKTKNAARKRKKSQIPQASLPEVPIAPPAPQVPAVPKNLIRFAVALLVAGVLLWKGGFFPVKSTSPSVKPHASNPGGDDGGPAPAPPLNVEIDGVKSLTGSTGWGGSPRKNESITGGALTMSGKTYPKGIGTHAPSTIVFALDGKVSKFHCLGGVDDKGAATAGLALVVQLDGKTLFKSKSLKAGTPPVAIDLNVAGGKQLSLIVDPEAENSWDQADWVDIQFKK